MKLNRVIQMLLLTCAALGACSAPREEKGSDSRPSYLDFDYGQPQGMTRADYAEFLRGEAVKLAEAELARLSAIELVYRNKVYFHSFSVPETWLKGGAYVKMYRQFTDFSLVNITHTMSLLHPITFTLDFEYDLIATDPVLVDISSIKAAQTARKRGNPSYFRSDTMRRVYLCDEMGVPETPLPGPPMRPNYWDKGEKQVEVFSLKEVPEIRAKSPSLPRKSQTERRKPKKSTAVGGVSGQSHE